MATFIGDFESQKMRKIFEFIKKYGIFELQSFFTEYDILRQQDLLGMAIMEGKHPTLAFVNKHRDVCRLIKEIDYLGGSFIFRHDVRSFLTNEITDEIIEKYIECARSLEEIGVSKIRFMPNKACNISKTMIKYDCDGKISSIIKNYFNSDCLVEYSLDDSRSNECFEVYNSKIIFHNDYGNFIITSNNKENDRQVRHAIVSDFLFDVSLIPSERELSSYEVPETLRMSKVYTKRK